MQVDPPTVARYEREAPHLREAVESGEAEFVMRRDPDTGFCVKLGSDGWCTTHREYGTDMLGDACHLFPRMPRALGETVMVVGTLSCPELARRMLYGDAPFTFENFGDPRQPFLMRNYLPQGLSESQAIALHTQLLALAADMSVRAERSLMRISAIARALETQTATAWPDTLPMYVMLADGRLPAAEMSVNDPFNLLHTLHGLTQAATSRISPRLTTVIVRLADALGVTFEGAGIQLSSEAAVRALRLHERARADWLQPVLRRYLQAQLSQSLFPFSGFGATLGERVTTLGLRFAIARLALASLSETGEQPVIDTLQPLSRFLDHLADPALTLAICHETGWTREARLRALVGDL